MSPYTRSPPGAAPSWESQALPHATTPCELDPPHLSRLVAVPCLEQTSQGWTSPPARLVSLPTWNSSLPSPPCHSTLSPDFALLMEFPFLQHLFMCLPQWTGSPRRQGLHLAHSLWGAHLIQPQPRGRGMGWEPQQECVA